MGNDNKTLHLVLKRKWWDMISSGEKKEEYREVCHYWAVRLLSPSYRWYSQNIDYPRDYVDWVVRKLSLGAIAFRGYEKVCFHLGYTNTTMTFRIGGMDIGTRRNDWGAEPGRTYFIISLGERVAE